MCYALAEPKELTDEMIEVYYGRNGLQGACFFCKAQEMLVMARMFLYTIKSAVSRRG